MGSNDGGNGNEDGGDGQPIEDAGGDGAKTGGDGAGCTAAAEQLLGPIDSVSTGAVTVLSDDAGTKTLYVDASAGGVTHANANPRLYLNLASASRVDVTDKTAAASTEWDLALKRPILFTNSGDGGPGTGGAVLLAKNFDAVTTADASGETFTPESFFEMDCTPKLDPTGAVSTSFDGWYDYDTSTNEVTPHEGTWLVKGATGKLYKVEILSFYSTPEGDAGEAGGRYLMKVGAL